MDHQDKLKGVTKADWQAHRHHPVSILQRHFLEDYNKGLEAEAWAHLAGRREGPVNVEYLLEIVGRHKACLELADLPFESVQQFYSVDSEIEDGESEHGV